MTVSEYYNHAVREALAGNAHEVRGILWEMSTKSHLYDQGSAMPGVCNGRKLSEDADRLVGGEGADEAAAYRYLELTERAAELENAVAALQARGIFRRLGRFLKRCLAPERGDCRE